MRALAAEPLCFMPPKGAAGSETRPRLSPTMPDSICSAAQACPGRGCRGRRRPNSVSLARGPPSASVAKGWIGATGPKISSLRIVLGRDVGRAPSADRRSPCPLGVAAREDAARPWRPRPRRAIDLVHGLGLIIGPHFGRRLDARADLQRPMRSASSSAKASWMPRWT